MDSRVTCRKCRSTCRHLRDVEKDGGTLERWVCPCGEVTQQFRPGTPALKSINLQRMLRAMGA